ncbi:MAG: hypothetical protein IH987_09330 [Planctomycetes bacterium]|nr:hypothetical protein [Planctomycetota bacterium]
MKLQIVGLTAFLFVFVGSARVQAALDCAVVTTGKNCYTKGEQVGFTITNTNCNLINLRNGGPWIIKDAQGNEVFRPACVTLAITPLAQGGSASFSWDQLNDGTGQVGCNYANQAQVPNGTYQACVEYTNADFTVNDTACASFEIDDDCIDDGVVPTVSGWGLAIIVVALLAGLTIKVRRQHAAGK